jgi:16S rRNA (uracil1498-N3)-methyltransferase
MAFPRIYYPGEIFAESVIQLSGSAARHVVRVLRLQPGDGLILFNGKGGEFRGRIERTQRDGATVAVEQYLDVERESPLVISLAQAVCAGEKMDWIVQKAVELGVSDIQVLAAKRGTTKLSDERADKRIAHWRQVAISACEQCGRNRIPQIRPLAPLPIWLGSKMDE